jgi:arginyl-tRNA synthetase
MAWSLMNPFARAAQLAVAEALSMPAERFAVTAPPRPELGDFAVGCFPAAKELRQAPPAVAARVAAGFQPGELLEAATAAGPFVNFRARRGALYRHVVGRALAGQPIDPVMAGQTVCIDYSSPNISKHLAYHHIRSTVIGHALVNLNRALGYRVIGINHLGDWGTTHGMLIAAARKWGEPTPLDIDGLNALYVRFRKAMESEPALEDEARGWFKKLEDGDPEARAIWKRFKDVSWAEFDVVYRELGIAFEEVKGESDFEADMPRVLALLAERGLSAESEGALVVPLDDLDIPPLLLKKQDGATLYATRDLAAAIYRWDTYRFARSLYVVDRGQALHFKQLFATLERAGMDWASRCAHVPFGLVRIGGKKTGTRTGNVVLLKEVLAEAAERARDRVKEKNPAMADAALADTARAVGVGAVVFANLASQREKDVDFEWEEVLATEGDSGPYLQYAHARSASVLARAVEAGDAIDPATLGGAELERLTSDLEWQLAGKLCELGDVVARAADASEPHVVARYLLDLVAAYSRWYTAGSGDPALRVLCDDPATRRARLALVAATKEILRYGLALLGLGAPEKM